MPNLQNVLAGLLVFVVVVSCFVQAWTLRGREPVAAAVYNGAGAVCLVTATSIFAWGPWP
jgi:hypothetical protein